MTISVIGIVVVVLFAGMLLKNAIHHSPEKYPIIKKNPAVVIYDKGYAGA